MSAQAPAAVVRLLNDVEALRRFSRLYPADHPALVPARERIRLHAAEFETNTPLTLGIAPDSFMWSGEVLRLPAGAPASRLLKQLFHLGIVSDDLLVELRTTRTKLKVSSNFTTPLVNFLRLEHVQGEHAFFQMFGRRFHLVFHTCPVTMYVTTITAQSPRALFFLTIPVSQT